jgi:putative ABC transport system permease protein
VVAAQQTFLPVTPLLGVMVVVFAVAAVGIAAAGRLGHSRAVLTASLRAAVQLAAVSAVIAWVVGAGGLAALFVLLMYVVASRTAGRRITDDRSGWWAAASIGAGTGPVIALSLVSGLLPVRGIVLIPVAGILIGGALTATALAGRRALDELAVRKGEVEAALALGFTDRDAALEICRPAAAQALIPALDQTRTVGLVTLPGAFIGMLLGGASPIEAGAVQLFVLVALLAVESTAILVTIELVATGRFRRVTIE